LTQTAASIGIEISPQGLDYRFTKEASECLFETLSVAAGALICDNPVAIPILRRFHSVYIQDSSVVVLPDDVCVGLIQICLSVVLIKASINKSVDEYKGQSIVRLKSSVDEHKAHKDKLDMPILLGLKERMHCRMLARSLPEEVAKERRRKIRADASRRGKTPSKSQLKLANWTIIVTSVPQELLTLDEAFVLLRVRFKIELLFKLWKSHGKIDDWRTEKPFRILCEFYAKLLAMLIQHWILLSGCWRFPNRSIVKASKTVQKHAQNLAVAFASRCRERLSEALEVIGRCLAFGCRLNKREKKPNTYQLLLELT